MGYATPWRRSVNDRVLAGVCGGLSEYYAINSNLLRIGWIFISLWVSFRWGVILYIAAAVLLPNEDRDPQEIVVGRRDRTPRWLGLILMAVGGLLLADILVPEIIRGFMTEIRRIGPPLLLIAIGMWILLRNAGKKGE